MALVGQLRCAAGAGMSALWVVGDVHGAVDKLRALLIQAGLTNRYGVWTGENAHVVFLGDYVDRGPDGIGVIRLIRQLEEDAARAGGQVTALLGNHEVMLLAAQRFRLVDPTDRLGFYDYWAGNGGKITDLQRLEGVDIAWLAARPGMKVIGPWLMVHADSMFYTQLGRSVEEVNTRIQALLSSTEPTDWGTFANTFVDRLNYAGHNGEALARNMLNLYGGERLVHGHTPVHLLYANNEQEIESDLMTPIEYAGGACMNVDSGMAYFMEAGFITRLEGKEVAEVKSVPESVYGKVSDTKDHA